MSIAWASTPNVMMKGVSLGTCSRLSPNDYGVLHPGTTTTSLCGFGADVFVMMMTKWRWWCDTDDDDARGTEARCHALASFGYPGIMMGLGCSVWVGGLGVWVVGLCVGWFGGSSTQEQKHENKHKAKQHKNMRNEDTKKKEKMMRKKSTRTKTRNKWEKSRHTQKQNEKNQDMKKWKNENGPASTRWDF